MKNTGIIIRSTGSWYTIRGRDETVDARIRGKFRLDGKKLTNPVAVGDRVEYDMEEHAETALITKILPRENYVVRQSPRLKHNLHLMASNIDQAILVVTIVQPHLKQGFIDRFILMTEPHDIPVTIIFNKSDLWTEEEHILYEALNYIYSDIGYDTLAVSALNRDGVDQLREVLRDKISLVSGQSGVGKTTLLNAIQPNLGLKTGDLSDYTGKGMHTTTFAEMFELQVGGSVIDTPGIKTLSFNNLEPMDVAHNFREIFEHSKNCRFHDCLHRNEPKCAVKDAVEEGNISELRYMNYLQILEEIEAQNYWERHTDL